MGFFKKLLCGDNSPDNSCPEGSVHAYEYDGVLYKTLEARDRAKAKDRRDRAVASLQTRMAYYSVHVLEVYPEEKCFGSYVLTSDTISKARHSYDKKYSLKELAQFLIDWYPKVKEDLELINKERSS